ncbi:Phage antirepressor protein KilAC domain-containing protein [Amphritea atlantica]|uniref:Phage antirepressor protein KilAC domain-containing protein n=1 Tax=Amphritea atlantica TaxID=355243 RepID=A0A1H9GEX2_9GAMM|nr:phage antirepressor KilAC domain-containing protein [Amphritea atlantica]SEQ48358.1 Phage antirepressor protein KilAC domain-containing protein [Amphritea atlantica]
MRYCIDMKEAAQRTGIKGGRNALFALLKKHGHLNKDNTASHTMIKLGYMRNELKQARTHSGIERNYYKPAITPTGISWLHEFVKQHAEIKPEAAA